MISGKTQEYANWEAIRLMNEYLNKSASFGFETNLSDVFTASIELQRGIRANAVSPGYVVAAVRLDQKYANYEVDNDLLEEIAGSFNSYYLEELQKLLVPLKQGIRSLNLLITVLICCSLFFGVLIPLILLLVFSADSSIFREWVAGLAHPNWRSFNFGLVFNTKNSTKSDTSFLRSGGRDNIFA